MLLAYRARSYSSNTQASVHNLWASNYVSPYVQLKTWYVFGINSYRSLTALACLQLYLYRSFCSSLLYRFTSTSHVPLLSIFVLKSLVYQQFQPSVFDGKLTKSSWSLFTFLILFSSQFKLSINLGTK